MNFDVKITNGAVFDGLSDSPTHCDIGINKNTITKMGELSAATAEKTIDATDLTICPGFIDTHSHSDTYLLIEPSAASKIYQGITTEICGNCGASAAPLNGGYKMPSDWLDKDYSNLPGSHTFEGLNKSIPWKTVAEYRELYDAINPAINVALLVGHNTLHAGICGYKPRTATPGELSEMLRTLETALDDGAIGLSSGLAYPPGPRFHGRKSLNSVRSSQKKTGSTPRTCAPNPAGCSKPLTNRSILPGAPMYAYRFPTSKHREAATGTKSMRLSQRSVKPDRKWTSAPTATPTPQAAPISTSYCPSGPPMADATPFWNDCATATHGKKSGPS
ncbi:hypothetical protein EGM51_12905 [Verrucomicrobia bacterium S94]|nr:hypothetical protein EGM51_12905 [Verrucomicrobia bacterium S94]